MLERLMRIDETRDLLSTAGRYDGTLACGGA